MSRARYPAGHVIRYSGLVQEESFPTGDEWISVTAGQELYIFRFQQRVSRDAEVLESRLALVKWKNSKTVMRGRRIAGKGRRELLLGLTGCR